MPRNEITDRERITDHVADVMHAYYRDTSIDTLLSRPTDAITMALEVGMRSGKIKSRDARIIASELKSLQAGTPAVFDVINEICRTALSSRKRGDLKRDRV